MGCVVSRVRPKRVASVPAVQREGPAAGSRAVERKYCPAAAAADDAESGGADGAQRSEVWRCSTSMASAEFSPPLLLPYPIGCSFKQTILLSQQ